MVFYELLVKVTGIYSLRAQGKIMLRPHSGVSELMILNLQAIMLVEISMLSATLMKVKRSIAPSLLNGAMATSGLVRMNRKVNLM
ncbi:hypothetical protein D3C77_674070 [compost metagenome]